MDKPSKKKGFPVNY